MDAVFKELAAGIGSLHFGRAAPPDGGWICCVGATIGRASCTFKYNKKIGKFLALKVVRLNSSRLKA
jgi:hypothetical protein